MAGTITALELQKHNQERVNVYLDGEFAFGLALLEAARLRKGQQLTDAEIAALTAHDAVQQAYDQAARFLANRPRSIAEVRRNLSEKQTGDAVIDEVIARLEARGYLDDTAFARYWIENRQQFRPRGSRALRFELHEKGVSNAIIDEALAGLDTSEGAYQVASAKARQLRGLDKRRFRERLSAYLARRGFDYDTIGDVIQRLTLEFQESDADAFTPLHDDIEE